MKSIENLSRVHATQVLTYLRPTEQPVELLINFSGATLKKGLRRVVNNYRPSASFAPRHD